jgi:hypothetical protein
VHLCFRSAVNISINLDRRALHSRSGPRGSTHFKIGGGAVLSWDCILNLERMSNVQTALNSRHTSRMGGKSKAASRVATAPPAWEVSYYVDGCDVSCRALTQFKWAGAPDRRTGTDGKGQDYPVSGPAVASPCCCALQVVVIMR